MFITKWTTKTSSNMIKSHVPTLSTPLQLVMSEILKFIPILFDIVGEKDWLQFQIMVEFNIFMEKWRP
jgi:hypothetical protein